jgi:PAS domain S-box-containing protein
MATSDGSTSVTRHSTESHDATERRRAEEALRESEERFRSAFEHAAIGMAVTHISGRFLQVNRALSEMLGYSEQELLATNFQAITNPEDLNTGLGYMRQVLAGEINSCQFEKRYFHKLGHEVWGLLSFSLVRDSDGSPLYFIAQIQDITRRKLAEEQLQFAREELEGRVERQLLRRNPYGLTFRELTVLHLVAAGKSDKEIGIDLGISPLTARKHISNILAKMDAASRTEAVARGLREGLLD